MKKFFAILFGLVIVIVVVLALLIAFAPARLVPQAIDEAEARNLLDPKAPQLILNNTSGTVWRGKAADAQLLIDGQSLPLGELNWRLHFWPLLQQRELVLDITTQADEHDLKANLRVNQQQLVTASGVEGKMPIKLLEPWVPLLVTGDIAFVLDHLVFSQQQLQAIDGIVNLEYIDWVAGDYNMPLGSYMAQVSLQQQAVNIQLDDLSAELGINGLITIQPNGSYVFDAMLQPRSGLAPEVADSLVWLGKRQPNGDIAVKSRGRL